MQKGLIAWNITLKDMMILSMKTNERADTTYCITLVLGKMGKIISLSLLNRTRKLGLEMTKR